MNFPLPLPSPTAAGLAVLAVVCGTVLGLIATRLVRRRAPAGAMWLDPIAWFLPRFGFALGGLVSLEVLDWWTVADAVMAMRAIAEFRLFDVSDSPFTLTTLAILALSVLVAYRVSGWAQAWIESQIADPSSDEASAVAVGSRLAHYVILLLGFGVGLQTAGIDLSAVFAAGAVFAIGVGFALQTLSQNFVSGVILLVEGAIKPGDILVVEGETVRVVRMSLRATIVRDRNDVEHILPNSLLVASPVLNQTMSDRKIRVRAQVGVSYDSDLAQVMRSLEQAAMAFEPRDSGAEPVIQLTEFGASSVNFDVSVWTDKPWDVPKIRSALYFAIWDRLKADQIVIAYPQLDLHLDPGAVTALQGGRGSNRDEPTG